MTIRLLTACVCLMACLFVMAEGKPSSPFRVPVVDLDAVEAVHTVVDREQGQYLGHPTTVLLEDGKTILCVYPKGHGRGGIVYKRSTDGGKTWSDRLPTPKSWAESKEVPTIHRVVDAKGKKRLIVWSGLYPARLSVSDDDGQTWSELKQAGDWGGIVVMGCVVKLNKPGRYMAMFHDDGRFFAKDGKRAKPVVFKLFKTFSDDGGLTWSKPEVVWAGSDVHLCEPGAVWRQDGKQLAILLRENKRVRNSHIIFSNDQGVTFTDPVELPNELTGDRHTAVYDQDGRLFISFRDRSPKAWTSPTEGDWVAWVGSYQDLLDGGSGDYRVRIKDNHHQWDCAYPGVVILDNQTIVTTTYGHWDKGHKPYIRTARFKLSELDTLREKQH